MHPIYFCLQTEIAVQKYRIFMLNFQTAKWAAPGDLHCDSTCHQPISSWHHLLLSLFLLFVCY